MMLCEDDEVMEAPLVTVAVTELKTLHGGRLKCTALAVSEDYLALGSHTGSVYLHERATLRFVQLMTHTSVQGRIASLAFSVDQKYLAVVTENAAHILEPRLQARTDRVRLVRSVGDHQAPITALMWAVLSDEDVLFTGDEKGVVYKTAMRIALGSTSEYLYQCDSPVVQLAYHAPVLLASSRTRVDLIDFAAGTARQVGKQPRQGSYGATFWADGSSVSVLCARPLQRVWRADLQGRVLATAKFAGVLGEKVQVGKLEVAASVALSWDSNHVVALDVEAATLLYAFPCTHVSCLSIHGRRVYVIHGDEGNAKLLEATFSVSALVKLLDSRGHSDRALRVLEQYIHELAETELQTLAEDERFRYVAAAERTQRTAELEAEEAKRKVELGRAAREKETREKERETSVEMEETKKKALDSGRNEAQKGSGQHHAAEGGTGQAEPTEGEDEQELKLTGTFVEANTVVVESLRKSKPVRRKKKPKRLVDIAPASPVVVTPPPEIAVAAESPTKLPVATQTLGGQMGHIQRSFAHFKARFSEPAPVLPAAPAAVEDDGSSSDSESSHFVDPRFEAVSSGSNASLMALLGSLTMPHSPLGHVRYRAQLHDVREALRSWLTGGLEGEFVPACLAHLDLSDAEAAELIATRAHLLSHALAWDCAHAVCRRGWVRAWKALMPHLPPPQAVPAAWSLIGAPATCLHVLPQLLEDDLSRALHAAVELHPQLHHALVLDVLERRAERDAVQELFLRALYRRYREPSVLDKWLHSVGQLSSPPAAVTALLASLPYPLPQCVLELSFPQLQIRLGQLEKIHAAFVRTGSQENLVAIQRLPLAQTIVAWAHLLRHCTLSPFPHTVSPRSIVDALCASLPACQAAAVLGQVNAALPIAPLLRRARAQRKAVEVLAHALSAIDSHLWSTRARTIALAPQIRAVAQVETSEMPPDGLCFVRKDEGHTELAFAYEKPTRRFAEDAGVHYGQVGGLANGPAHFYTLLSRQRRRLPLLKEQ